MGALKKSGGYCVGSTGALVRVNGGMEKGSMVALKRVNERVPKGQVTPYVVWGCLRGRLTHCLRDHSFGLRRGHAIRCLRGGLTRTCADLSFAYADIHMTRLLHSMMTGVLERAPMGALVRANAGIEKGQWGRWSGSMGVGVGQGQWG